MSNEKKSITELGNPRKPHGEAGVEMLNGMNERHYAVTGWALDFLDIHENDRILDIGCGGGETLNRMAEKVTSGHLTGADYSELSVKMSTERNERIISSGKMDVIEAGSCRCPEGRRAARPWGCARPWRYKPWGP